MDKTELNPTPPGESTDIAEQQLSITFDDIEQKKNGVMSTEEYLKIQKSLNKGGGTAAQKKADKPAGQTKTDEPVKAQSKPGGEPQSAKKDAPKATEKPAESVQPAPHLSDMEVMEHTASIWQYKEITDNGTEMHSEYHEKRTVTPFAEVIGARVRGKKHKHEGTNCDDYFETAVTDDCVITVVCDGAGSKPLSRIGSRVSAESATAYLKTKTTELFKAKPELKSGLAADLGSAEFMAACGRIAPLVQEAAREAFAAQQKTLGELAADKKYEDALGRKPAIGDLSTTFLAAVIVPVKVDGKPQTFMACVQIGDGCICAIDSTADSSHCLKLMGEADSGAFSGETDFLSEKNSKAEVIGGKTRISRGNSDTVLLMSDGVADDYFPAQPMMERLYLDLCLNGILPMEGECGKGGEDPAPIRFRSVSITQQSVALQYAKQLLGDKSDAAMAALWDKRNMLRCHSLEAFRMNIGDTPEERLRVWLDNYNERGSFDDRTLTAVRIPRK
ncbi:MAG: protein phosphatase 2C domain-containing protein [Oscillospiraceae bacterium]|nr:protein phosphatase 2C domain-containing protein [Oscillospiraceae bacterium]